MSGLLPDGVSIVNGKKFYSPEFKLKVVLESCQRDTTIEAVKTKFGVANTALYAWRDEFKSLAPTIFTKEMKGKRSQTKTSPGQSPDELKRIIGELTVQNEILKKVQGLLS
jgi:transposase